MKNIENLFVSYELALLAKDLKLEDVCIGAYNKKGDFLFIGDVAGEHYQIPAPIYQQLIDWLELNYELFIERIWNDDRSDNYILWLTKNSIYQELKSIDVILKDALLMIKEGKIDKKHVN